jgi:hypothetical protein
MAITLKDIRPMSEANPTPIADSIKTSISEALNAVPEGKTGAVLAYVDETGTVHGVAAAKLGEHWTLFATADYHGREKNFDGQAGVQFTW